MTNERAFHSAPAALALAMLAAASAGPAAVPQSPPAAASARLLRVTETRQRVVHAAADENAPMMMQDRPGLALAFGIEVPAGLKLFDLEQPDSIKAADSAGTDLARIEPGFMGKIEYLELAHAWDDEPPREFTFSLAMSSRAAATFSLNASLKAHVYSDTDTIEVELGEAWTRLPAALATGTGPQSAAAEARLTSQGDSVGIEIRPEAARRTIQSIAIIGDDHVTENNGWFSDGQTITYMFDAAAKPPVKARFTVRTGVQTLSLSINLVNEALP